MFFGMIGFPIIRTNRWNIWFTLMTSNLRFGSQAHSFACEAMDVKPGLHSVNRLCAEPGHPVRNLRGLLQGVMMFHVRAGELGRISQHDIALL